MKKEALFGVFMVCAMGTLFHFIYEWIPIFVFPQNESIFEHTKLVVFPFILYGTYYLIRYKEDRRASFSSLISAMVISIIIIITGYYTYSGFIGKNIDAVNIILYYIGVIAGFLFFYKKKTLFSFHNSIIYFIIIFIMIVVWSYFPPDLAFFWS